MHHARAFTLLEILVALAICGLIAAILFPVFVRARAKVQQSTCQSNLRQIGLATLIYVQDNDDKFPGLNSAATWQQRIRPYSPQFLCPVRKSAYGCNHVVVKSEDGLCVDYRFKPGCSIGEVVDPARTVWVTDSWPNRTTIDAVALEPSWVSPRGTYLGYPFLFGGTAAADYGVVGWHFDRANVLFADGHVKAMPLEALATRRGGRAVWWTKEED